MASIIIILFSSIYIALLPTTTEKLTKQSWCVDHLIYNGKNYPLNTIEQIRITGVGFCNESIDFRTNGTIVLPGFNSNSIWGKWHIDENTLYVQQVDTFDFVYNGVYTIDFSNKNLILKSKQTTIYCHPEEIKVNLPF